MSRLKVEVARRRRVAAGYVFGIVVLVFAARHLGIRWADVGGELENLPVWSCALGLSLFLFGLLINAVAFVYANKALGVDAPGSFVAGAWLATVLAKYLPIGVGHIVGRGVLLARSGVPVRATVVTGGIEQSLSIFLCAWFASAAWVAMSWSGPVVWLAVALPVALLIIGVTFVRLWLPLIVDPKAFWLSASLYGIAMIPFYFGYAALVFPTSWLEFAFAIFGGTLAGAAAVFVPGGLGVREAATAALSGPADNNRLLTGLVVARLLVLLTECVGSAVGARFLARSANRS